MTIPYRLVQWFYCKKYDDWGDRVIPYPGDSVSVCTLVLRIPILLFWIAAISIASPLLLLVWLYDHCPWQVKVR